MKIRDIKDSRHLYRGFEILGTYRRTEGGWVLGGRHYKEGGIKRNYNIKLNGKYFIHPDMIYETLKDAKDEIDQYYKQKGDEFLNNEK